MDNIKGKEVFLRNLHNYHNEIEIKSSRPGNIAFELSTKKKILDYILLFISALLYSSAFPPLNWSFMGWVSICPLFMLIQNKTIKSAFIYSYFWGYIWALTSFFWLREIEIFIPFLIALILAFFPALWGAFIPFFIRYLYYPEDIIKNGFTSIDEYKKKNQYSVNWNIKDIHFALFLSAIWVFLEWIRSWIFTGLPWNLTAITQWKNPALIQISDITGAYGVSFVIIMMNIAIGLTLQKLNTMISEGKFRRPIVFYFALIVLMLCIAYGSRAIIKNRPSKNPEYIKIAVIQPNIPQCRIPTEEQALFALRQNLELIEMAVVSEPYLIVLPETAIPLPFNSTHPIATEFRNKVQKYAMEKNILFLIGTIMFSESESQKKMKDFPVYNSAILIGKNGKIIQQYNKIHLVPFGEYTPFGKYFEPLKKYFGMGRDLTAGKDYTIFEFDNNINGAVNICYEDIFPQISRKMVKRGADILFILTNDAWYPESSEPEQHFAHSIFRAIENRIRIIRCGNNSFSCLISPIGTVEESISYTNDPKTGNPIPAPEKKTRGYSVFKVEIPQKQNTTIYTYYGDIFILICFAFLFFSYLEIFWKWKSLKTQIKSAFEK